jgi:hypothetical protein
MIPTAAGAILHRPTPAERQGENRRRFAVRDPAAHTPMLTHLIHRHFLWLLIGSYAVAANFPRLGLWIKDFSVAEVVLFGSRTRVSLSMVFLASRSIPRYRSR